MSRTYRIDTNDAGTDLDEFVDELLKIEILEFSHASS
jgi:hypothetical protein